jgi:P-type Cu2+ transporter
VAKVAGDVLVGGSLNLGGPVEMDVQRTGADTRYEAIVTMMREAATQRPALARLADRWATPFVWIVLLLAAGAAAAWSVIDPSRAVWVAVSVLIVTCPCALSLAAPAALTAAAGGLARRGVLVQRLDAIEALARVRQLFIDKTGTLTEDRLQLSEVQGRRTRPRRGAGEGGVAGRLVAAPAVDGAGGCGAGRRRRRGLAGRAGNPARAWSGVMPRGAPGGWARQPGSAPRCRPRPRSGWRCEGVLQAAFCFDERLREGATEAMARRCAPTACA